MSPSRARKQSLFSAARLWTALGVLGAALVSLSQGPGAAQAQSGTDAAIRGIVTDVTSGAPVAGAQVSVPALGLSTTTGGSGRFDWDSIALSQFSQNVTVEVRASGYGEWILRDAWLVQADALQLDVSLGIDAVEIVIPPARPETREEPVEGDLVGRVAGSSHQLDAPLPSTIRVRVTGYAYCDLDRPYTVQVIDFHEYVRHVLPNEWGPTWPWESLHAGAMAAKMYAWRLISIGGKWSDADVYDSTCDQVYIPSVSYASTDRAINDTWNWRLTKDGSLMNTAYRAYYSQCVSAGLAGRCMGQWDTYYHAIGNNGYDKLTWDEMLYRYYVGTLLTPVWDPPGGFSLRYFGNGFGDIDRVKIPLDAPARPVDVGGTDFSIEWWMKANGADNPSTAVQCDTNDGWTYGNILIDRDIFGPGELGDYGVSLTDGRPAFGASLGSTGTTICGATDVADGDWHHVAVTRRVSDGRLQIYVDGDLDAEGDGPDGDLSYADGRATTHGDDPYLVLGAEKHDAGPEYPSYDGFLDEMRISSVLRYEGSFTPPSSPFDADSDTVGLYHFNEGFGNTISDDSGVTGGPSTGLRKYGGSTNGPEWMDDSPWFVAQPTPTPYYTATRTPTASNTPTASRTPTPTRTATPTATFTPSVTISIPPPPTFTRTPTPAGPTATATLTATPIGPGSLVSSLTFQTVVSGLSQPVFVGHAGDGSGRLFVLERAGRIRVVTASGSLLGTPFLDLTSIVQDAGNEQGLLGLAFHPDYDSNGVFFVAYTNSANAVVLSRYSVSSNPDIADSSSGQILLSVSKSFTNHNGGMLAFGPDGYLYWSIGDGGGAGDPGNNAQSRTVLLGKILRLDVDSATPYAIPADNPFVNDPDPNVREEIWAYGLRNPWRFSFDRTRGDLFIGDVGQGNREEVDYEAADDPGGRNYGWRVMEGSLCFSPSTGCDTTGKVLPVAEYNTHDSGGCAVTGGYVYRGNVSPQMRGVYFYGDYCSGRLWGLSQTSPGTWVNQLIVDTAYTLSSFGEDEAGELYLTDYSGGRVVRIIGPEAPRTFADVPPTHWAFPYIEALYREGFVIGCQTTPTRLYCPDTILSRAESAVFAERGQHGAIPDPPYPNPASPTFADVPASFWGFGWIESLWTDGFTAGCQVTPTRLYCPNSQHTRAEGSVFFLRIQNGSAYEPPTPSGIFSDVSPSAWYVGWVEAAFNQGILPACATSPLRFCPESPLDRAWAAYMMVQAKDIPIQ
jgi:glucose/arabinose dehydrogenase